MNNQLTEIRWHSRAGQGAITASNALAEIIGGAGSKSVQSFCEYGAEKRGAPVAVFTRISEDKIDFLHQIENPNFVVLFDTTLINPQELSPQSITAGLNKNGKLLINANADIKEYFQDFKGEIFTIDATGIAMTEIGKNIPNIPMVGALLKISGIYPIEAFAEQLKTILHKLPQKIIDGNLKALVRGSLEVSLINK